MARNPIGENAAGARGKALGAAVLLVLGCAGSVKEVEPKSSQSGAERRQYRVECIELDQCREKAAAACGSEYEVISEWHNTIPESDLPGLNEETRPKDGRDFNHLTLPLATGIESDDPMPAASLVVACNR